MTKTEKQKVMLVFNTHNRVVSVYAEFAEAVDLVQRYNNDPYIDGECDPDAPYYTQEWRVQEGDAE